MSFGLVTGSTSLYWALIADGRGGLRALAALEAMFETLPPTPTIQLADGLMSIFALPEGAMWRSGNSLAGLPLQVRAENGWILLPPSLDEEGTRMRWKYCPFGQRVAATPTWLQTLVGGAVPPSAKTVAEPASRFDPQGVNRLRKPTP